MSDIEFINGLMAKRPNDNAPEFVKAAISIKREELIAWLSSRNDEWINADIKESKGGRWYIAVSSLKSRERKNHQSSDPKQSDHNNSDSSEIPF